MTKVDIRVGKVVDVQPNTEGEKLFNEQNIKSVVEKTLIYSGKDLI